jgi:transcriptional regulator with XRE-family HTH domain
VLYVEQVRAARALLAWNQSELAAKAGISVATLKRLESFSGMLRGTVETAWRIQGALEKAGIVFIDNDETGGPGVRLAKRLPEKR